ncbi:MAG: HEAT repeat domain-containing protein [Polyangiaceae bacterium]|jgi:HEAT repeat protein
MQVRSVVALMVKTMAWALTLVLVSRTAAALVWPDVAARAERDLSSADSRTRREAAERLSRLGPLVATPLVLAALRDTDDSVRIAAADAAIRLHVRDATEAIRSWLNAPNSRLRVKACEVASRLPDPRAIQGLARALGDSDSEVRSAAAEALGHQRADESVPPLLGRLDDQSPAVRVSIVGALARLHDGRAVLPLAAKVQDSSVDVREAAALALGALRDPRASPVLVLALRDTQGEVQRSALRSLGRLRAGDAVDAIAACATDRSAATRLGAIRALGEIASPPAVRTLVGMLGVGDDAVGPLERSPVRDALVDCGASAVDAVAALLDRSPNQTATASAAWVLGMLGAHDHARDVVASMRRGILPVAAALHALAGAGTADEVAVVLEFVSSTSPTIRDQALIAAASLLDPSRPDGRAVEPLEAALLEPNTTAKQQARLASLLGRTGAARAAPVLASLVRAHNSELQLAAVDALAMIGPAGADAALLQAMDSPDPILRLHAATALGHSGSARTKDALIDRLDRGDEVDRASVLIALGGVLARAPDEHAIARLASWLPLAVGAERDAMIEAIGRAPLASVVRVLAFLTESPNSADRQTATALLAAHRDSDEARVLARARLLDSDPRVRAQAAWTMGTLGGVGDTARLAEIARSESTEIASNAVASLARILATIPPRAPQDDRAEPLLCSFVGDARPEVRTNALAGLALTARRCDGGAAERAALTSDPDESVRSAAARAVARFATGADVSALAQCADGDPSRTVASFCRAPKRRAAATHDVLVYVLPNGATAPRPEAAYCMVMADGTLRLGTADRRGAVFDAVAPRGDVALCRPRW